MLTLLFSYLPIVLLIYLMTRKNSMPSYKALPLMAGMLYLIMLVVFRRDPNLVHANIVDGLLTAWTPILIIAGAIFLFRTMETTGSLGVIRQWLNTVSTNKVAQLMIVGWAFPFLIEGASGFGTPAAIAAPILVGLGFSPVGITVLALIMNSVPVSFGAVGTPTWFGFSGLTLTPEETLIIGFKSAIMNGAAAFVIPFAALMFVVKPGSVFKNAGFILLSVAVTVIPYVIVAKYNYEFPSLVGGSVGLIFSALFAKMGLGLSKEEVQLQESEARSTLVSVQPDHLDTAPVGLKKMVTATFPLWGTLLLLIVTRIPDLGIKSLLTLKSPNVSLSLGTLGEAGISPALVVSLTGIFETPVSWTHSLLYVPSFLPFGVISLATFALYRDLSKTGAVFSETVNQVKKPTLALLGALVFVNLMMMGESDSAVAQIGQSLADLTGSGWRFAAPYLGAVGSFFSGSNTISNLTFGGIQDTIAGNLGLERTTILAMQSVGGAMGNMVCINNIVAVASVLALGNIEGVILRRTVKAMIVYGVVVNIVGLFL